MNDEFDLDMLFAMRTLTDEERTAVYKYWQETGILPTGCENGLHRFYNGSPTCQCNDIDLRKKRERF